MQWSVATCCRTVVRKRSFCAANSVPQHRLILEPRQLHRDHSRDISAFRPMVLFHIHVCLEFENLIPFMLVLMCPPPLSFILYMKLYPEHLKYVEIDIEAPNTPLIQIQTPIKSSEWRASIVCAWITFGHLYVCPSEREGITISCEIPG